ncbi:MAG TPA: cell division protein DivIVA [Pseudonocardiaceae bacterium]|jgi:chromosome segregation ATPase|nr:cell division protein DivIVA [Pseudonocardiaceae bacterium]
MARPEDRDLVPLKPGFDVVWHGFDRAQVKQYLEDLEDEIKLISSDRDAALSQVSDLTDQLTNSHSRIADLNKQVTELVELPKNTDDLDERCKRMVQLAHHQSSEITARAQAAATHGWASAEDAAAKLRAGYDKLLGELTKQHQEVRAQHGQVVEQARTQVAEMTTAATKRRHELDAQAEQRRIQIEQEFERSMASKRQALAKEIEQQRAGSRSEAERLVRDATEEAERRVRESSERAERKLRETVEDCNRRITDATRQVQELQSLRQRLTEQLRSAHALMRDASPMLEPMEDEQHTVDGVSSNAAGQGGQRNQPSGGQQARKAAAAAN